MLKYGICILFIASFLVACATPAPGVATTRPPETASATTAGAPAPVSENRSPTPVAATATAPGLATGAGGTVDEATVVMATATVPTVNATPTVARPSATPTSGPLNQPVVASPIGGYPCGDYPCYEDEEAWEARIQLPPGFSATYYALLEPSPTSITFGPDGRLYVARQEGEIVIVDAQGNVEPYVDGFYYLVGIAFQPGTDRLFATSRAPDEQHSILWVIEDGEAEPLYDDLPCCYGGWHQANGIAFGPDGYGYVSVGARSDHGKGPLTPLEASVLRFDPSGGMIEPFASGLRNTFDIAWDGSGRLFGADNMPDFGPPEEFNRIDAGRHYGFPYYECGDCTPPPPDLEPTVGPLYELPEHSAPAGITAYLHDQFPGYYNNLFLALWSAFPDAQRILRFGPNGQGATDFATGFAAPVDVTVGPDGALFVADWATGIIFKITYTG